MPSGATYCAVSVVGMPEVFDNWRWIISPSPVTTVVALLHPKLIEISSQILFEPAGFQIVNLPERVAADPVPYSYRWRRARVLV